MSVFTRRSAKSSPCTERGAREGSVISDPPLSRRRDVLLRGARTATAAEGEADQAADKTPDADRKANGHV
jgi:hypothetical protein